MPKLVFNYANKYLHVTFVFDDGQHFSAHKGFKHLLYQAPVKTELQNALKWWILGGGDKLF